jgi:outer membrane protein OmpA-like peptidoglycan-associated protein
VRQPAPLTFGRAPASLDREAAAENTDASAPPLVPECPEPAAGALAFVRCDGDRIELAHPVAFHPGRSIPPEPARRVLDRVAAIMREEKDILLVRVEAYSSRRAGASAEARRHEIAESQARADAVLTYLWRRGGISAERLEAVGYGDDPRFSGTKERWPVVLRILQRAKRP